MLFLDFETKDHGKLLGLGAGWPYNRVDIIGYAYAFDDCQVNWLEDVKTLESIVALSDAIICHNAVYDVGILHMLGVNYADKLIYDTQIIAKLYNNTLISHGLNSLSRLYLNDEKEETAFISIAKELRLVKSSARDPIKYCKENLDVVYKYYPTVVIDYACQDVALTRDLFKFFFEDEYIKSIDHVFYSDLVKYCIAARAKGVRVSIDNLNKANERITTDINSVYKFLDDKYLKGLNPNSTQQLAQLFAHLGIQLPLTERGSPSVTLKFLESQDHELCQKLVEYKKLEKLKTAFIDKTYKMLSAILGDSVEDLKTRTGVTRIHPELNIMGGEATGRFSSKNPNIQQQPKRDEYARPLIRNIFLPEPAESLYCLDFSSQEPRLQIHYGCLAKDRVALHLAEQWKLNKDYDMHLAVAEIANISRTEAKTINLGLCLDGETVIETWDGDTLLKDIQVGDRVFTSQGNYRRVLSKTERTAGALKIITSTGKTLIASPEHRVLVTTPQGGGRPRTYSYKPVGELSTGMYLTPNVMERRAGNGVLGIIEAHALGFWLAEGHYNRYDYQMQACQHAGEYTDLVSEVFSTIGIRVLRPDRTGKCLFRYPKELRDLYVSIGLDVTKKARDKYIPRADYSIDEIRHILCGMWEGDGHITVRQQSRVSIVYTTTSAQLADDVVYYLQKLGITAKQYRTARFREKGIIDVHVVGNLSKRLFMERVPTYKNRAIEGRLSTTVEKIISIEPVSERVLYDIEVDVDHNFTANGLVVHNSYGMGLSKLAKSLKLTRGEAKELVNRYHKHSPFLKTLTTMSEAVLNTRSYIATIGGRRLYKEPDVTLESGDVVNFSYKAFNKLIQGGAADQTMAALVYAYRNNLLVSFPIHDEFVFSSSSALDVAKLKYIMENVIRLHVPSKTEVTVGDTFSNQTKTEIILNEAEQEQFNKFTASFTSYIEF